MRLSERDKKIMWHPFTQEKTAALPIAIQSAKGSYVYDEQGKAYLDCISSWWVNLHGHAHPAIAKSIYEQAMQLEHVIFAGFTHEPAVTLCEQLQAVLPNELCRFFYSDNGSTAVEVALKMAYQYWQNQGQLRRRLFLSFEGAYHGDTFGAMAVGGKPGFHDVFQGLFFEVFSLAYPATWEGDEAVDEKEQSVLLQLDVMLDQYGDQIAAMILEPLVQGAGGMRFCRAEFLRAVIARVRRCGILVIFDEVMTGFGRTGSYFALDQVGVVPDFVCLSKGVTGGFLPLALTVTTDAIYQAFLHDEVSYAFLHGHSYTANPLACAAALASLRLLRSDETQQAMAAINQAHREGLQLLGEHYPLIANRRVLGTISAFEVGEVNASMRADFLAAGLLIRPLGRTVYLMPPYSTTGEELRVAYERMVTLCSRNVIPVL